MPVGTWNKSKFLLALFRSVWYPSSARMVEQEENETMAKSIAIVTLATVIGGTLILKASVCFSLFAGCCLK